MFRERLIAPHLSSRKRKPDRKGGVDAGGGTETFVRQYLCAVLSEFNPIGFSEIRITNFEHPLPSVKAISVVECRHLPRKDKTFVFLFAVIFRNSPARIRHFFKDLSRIQERLELHLGLLSDASARVLSPGLPHRSEIGIGFRGEFFYAEQFALPAEDARVLSLPQHMVKHPHHTVVIALGRIKAAGRNEHMFYHTSIIAGGMPAAPVPVSALAHKRQAHGQLAVNQVFERPRHTVVIKRKTPDDQICGEQPLNHGLHIIFHAASSGRLLPAGKAALAGRNPKSVQMQLFDLDRPLPFALMVAYAIEKAVCETERVTLSPLGTSVNQQNLHALIPPIRVCTPHTRRAPSPRT